MTCQELLKVLLEYVGGELILEHRQTVEVHLGCCPNCVRLVETYTHTVRFARKLPQCDSLPPSVEARLRRMIEPELNKPTSVPPGSG